MFLLHIHTNRNHGSIRKTINKNFEFARNYNIFYLQIQHVPVEILEGSEYKEKYKS